MSDIIQHNNSDENNDGLADYFTGVGWGRGEFGEGVQSLITKGNYRYSYVQINHSIPFTEPDTYYLVSGDVMIKR